MFPWTRMLRCGKYNQDMLHILLHNKGAKFFKLFFSDFLPAALYIELFYYSQMPPKLRLMVDDVQTKRRISAKGLHIIFYKLGQRNFFYFLTLYTLKKKIKTIAWSLLSTMVHPSFDKFPALSICSILFCHLSFWTDVGWDTGSGTRCRHLETVLRLSSFIPWMWWSSLWNSAWLSIVSFSRKRLTMPSGGDSDNCSCEGGKNKNKVKP